MKELGTIAEFVNRAATQTGFERERFVENNLPTVFSNLVVVVFLGDLRSEFVLSSLLLHRYLKQIHPGKYVIVCSWPGHSGLFPYADEYWSVSDAMALRELSDKAVGFNNNDKRFEVYARNLRKYFENVLTWEDWSSYYDRGLTSVFLRDNDPVKVFLPAVTSVNLEQRKLINSRPGHKLFIHPVRVGRFWHRQEQTAKLKQDFWIELCERLLDNDITPVIYQDYAAYDISSTFGDKCVYISDRNITNVMGAMRTAGCVLDIYSGISKLAIAARCPFVACADRQYYSHHKDWEVNDLTASVPYKYIFSFPTILENGGYRELINNIVNVWKRFSAQHNVTSLPVAEETYMDVPYNNVRKHKARRIGMRFIKVERMVIE